MEYAKDPVDEYCEDAYPCEVEGLREMDVRHYNSATIAGQCLVEGYTIVSQFSLRALIEENRRLEQRVRELETIDIPF